MNTHQPLKVAFWASLLATSAEAFDYPIDITAPQNALATASWNVPHDFASFSFPAHWFADFCGNLTHPNLFSRDIFDLLYSKTGAHPFIRVGGTSTDRVVYNATQKEAVINWYDQDGSTTTEYGIPDMVYIGPSFFDGFHNFPGSRWSWQVNMGNSFGREGGLEEALDVAQMVLDITQTNLESFELGNEPDLMRWFGHRDEGYDLEQYVQDWNEYAAAVSEKVLKDNKYGLPEKRFFQGMTSAQNEEEWSLERAMELGLDESGFLRSVSWHQYANGNDPWVRLQNSYMNHTANAGNVSQHQDNIDLCRSYEPELPFVLGETNSNSYNLNMSQVEGVFGSALWLIDHLMLGMAANVTRYNLIQGTTFGYTGWVPIPLDGRDPYVRAPLYGQIFTADAIGHHPEVQVHTIPDLPWNTSAYGIYESSELARYVVINYDEWNATTSYARPSQEFSLSVPSWVGEVQVRRLTGGGASADEGIEWAGQRWNYTDGRLVEEGGKQWEVLSVEDGVVDLEIRSTEAILVDLSREVGCCGDQGRLR